MALAFTSLSVTEDQLVNCQGGWVFHICGEVCHLIGSLWPDKGVPPTYAQLYIYNSCLALHQRRNHNSNLHEDMMMSLQGMLLSNNWYAHNFRHVYEVLQDFPHAPQRRCQTSCIARAVISCL